MTRRTWLLRIGAVVVLGVSLLHAIQSQRLATLSVTITDAQTGEKTPVRVRLTDGEGNLLPTEKGVLPAPGATLGVPEEAIALMHGRWDKPEWYALQKDGSFYVDGSFHTELRPGDYRIRVSKGNEFVAQTHAVRLEPGERAANKYALHRWINMPERGWYSSDDHIHLRRSPREDPAILRWVAAEDIHVGTLLQVGDLWRTYFHQYGFGEHGLYREGNHILASGQEEPRTPEIGHTISLLAREFVRFQGRYYQYDQVFDRIRELGGIAGYAHQAMSFHGYRGMALDVPRGKVDFLELLQFCVLGGPLHTEHYYHFLDLGFRLTATAGSDFPWCGNGPKFGLEQGCHPPSILGCSQIGDARFYTYTGEGLTYDAWAENVKAGHTFVTSGPILDLKVNRRLPGETIDIERGAKVRVEAAAYGHATQIPLERLEIVGHGKVLESVSVQDSGQSPAMLKLELEIPIDEGIWIAARCTAKLTQVAHTTPVYVTVNGGGFHNPETLHHYLDLTEDYLQELERELAHPTKGFDFDASSQRKGLTERIAASRKALRALQENGPR